MEKMYARFIRGANEDTLSDLIEKMKKVSRITNAIYIQQGLIDGTIPPDDLLTDILKLKLIKSSDVVEMDSTKMKAGVDSLKTLAQSIKPTDTMKENLKYFLALNEIHDAVREQAAGGEWPKADNIKAEVKNFKDNEIAFSVVDKLLGYVKNFDEKIKKVEEPHDFNSQSDLSEVHTAFIFLREKGKLFLSDVKSLSQEHDDYKSINSTGSILPSLAVITQKIETARKCMEISGSLSHNSAAETMNIENFKKIDNFSKDGQKFQVAMVSELRHQTDSAKSSQYSFPFMDSGNNIVGLTDILKDPWIKSVIKSDGFPKSLKQISFIEELLRKIIDGLEVKNKIGSELQKVFQTIDLVSSVAYNSEETEKVAKQLADCEPLISRNQLQLDEIEKLFNQSGEFDNARKELKQAFADFVEVSKSQEFQKVLSGVVEISVKCTSSDANVVKAVLQEYQQYPDLTTFVNSIRGLKSQADNIKSLKKVLKERANNVHNKADEINTFKTAFTPFSVGFDCLEKVKNTEPLVEMVLLTQNVASLTTMTTGFSEIDKFIDKVSKVIPEIKRVKTEMNGMKGKNTPPTDALNELKNREIHSKTIGSATQRIANMATAIGKKNDFEGLKSELSLVKQESQKYPLDQKDMENLDKLVTIESDLSTMYQTLDTWMSSLKDPKSATLADYFPIFSDAKGVSEVTLDFHKTATSLQTLIDKVTDPGVKDKLMTVQKLVRDMDSVGMKFSDYSKAFDDLKTTLSALDTFFSNYGKSVAPSPGSSRLFLETTPLVVAPASIAIHPALKIFVIVIAVIVVCLILLIVGASIYYKYILKVRIDEYKRSRNEAKKVEKKRKSERKKEKTAQPVDKSKLMDFELNKRNKLVISEQVRGKATDELLVKLRQIKTIVDEKSAKSIQQSSRTQKGADRLEKEFNSDIYTYFWKLVKWNLDTTRMKEDKQKPNDVLWYKNKKHAKEVTFPIENSMFLTEPPQDSDEAAGFWNMIVVKKVEEIAMLCEDPSQTKPNSNGKFYQYFPQAINEELTFDQFKIKCTEVTEEHGGLVEYRTFEVKSQKQTKTIRHSQYKKDSKPLSPYMLATILGKVRSSKKPAVVHGETNERGTPEVFVFMEYLLQLMKKNEGKFEYYEALVSLRQTVPNAVKSRLLFGLSIISVFAYLYGNEVCPFIQKLLVEYSVQLFHLKKDNQKSTSKKKSWTDDLLNTEDAEVDEKRKQLSEKILKKEKPGSIKTVKTKDGDEKNKKNRDEPDYPYGQIYGCGRERHLVTVEDLWQDMNDWGEDDKERKVVKDKDTKDKDSKENDAKETDGKIE